jgi:hypothetical protein
VAVGVVGAGDHPRRHRPVERRARLGSRKFLAVGGDLPGNPWQQPRGDTEVDFVGHIERASETLAQQRREGVAGRPAKDLAK